MARYLIFPEMGRGFDIKIVGDDGDILQGPSLEISGESPLTLKTFRRRLGKRTVLLSWGRNVWFEPDLERAIRERAYFIWKHEGCPDGRAFDHWSLASAEERKRLNELMYEEEKVLADRPDANLPALLTQDVHGG